MNYSDSLDNSQGLRIFTAMAVALFVFSLGLSTALITTNDRLKLDKLQSYTLTKNKTTKAGF